MAQSLSNLTLGSKIKFGRYSINNEAAQEIIWRVVAINHSSTPAYPTNSVTLLADKVINVMAFDAAEPTNNLDMQRRTTGNNRYSVSNIDQWLNKDSDAGMWYVAQHEWDTPPSSGISPAWTPYETRPGFLNAFTSTEKAAILDTTIRVRKPVVDGDGYDDIVRKVFLPSAVEMGSNNTETGEGSKWAGVSSLTTGLTQQVYQYHPHKESIYDAYGGGNCRWWFRTPYRDNGMSVALVEVYENTITNWGANEDRVGIRPALNVSASLLVSDTTDGNGYYTIEWNTAPTTPTPLNVPANIYGGKYNTISWGASMDAEDNFWYQLECSYDGGEFTLITGDIANDSGITSYNHLVPLGKSTVQYRISARDNPGAQSGYTTSAVISVINNQAPVISDSDRNLGVFTDVFAQAYDVTDAEGDTVTVTESIDGTVIRSYVTSLGESQSFDVRGADWLKLSNGSHTMTIYASDANGGNSTRTYYFTKNVTSCSVQTDPMPSNAMPTRISLSVTKNIPPDALFSVEVCNNGNDAAPTWEDATDAVEGNMVHVFSNTSKTADSWAVMVKVTVDRNGGTGACYISSIGGNFE